MSLRDAIREAECVQHKGRGSCRNSLMKHVECAEVAARKWMVEWLRSDEAWSVGGWRAPHLADALEAKG